MNQNDTIAAVATGIGGALGVIRVSGENAIEICDSVFCVRSGAKLSDCKGYTLHYGNITDGEGRIVDDAVLSLFRSPRSYTGENMVEISCHGSQYIQGEIMKLLIGLGARSAQPGEFTIRAFLAGKLDLSQAEAVADMIASSDRATHALASNQMRGGYSSEFAVLRERLIELVSLLELELDFGEEDVEFADRSELARILGQVRERVSALLNSFNLGNAIKEGVGVAIVGSPNVGKSTLLNALLQEDRAMVSDIAGTTRDVIEQSLNIGGVHFRFIDTAGIRKTTDKLEQMGIERTLSTIERAQIVLLMVDVDENIETALSRINLRTDQKMCVIINKSDKLLSTEIESIVNSISSKSESEVIVISAKNATNIASVHNFLSDVINADPLYNGSTIVSNTRHYEALHNAQVALERADSALATNITADLLSQDLREVLHYLGTITGEITTTDILSSIFSKFCIGK